MAWSYLNAAGNDDKGDDGDHKHHNSSNTCTNCNSNTSVQICEEEMTLVRRSDILYPCGSTKVQSQNQLCNYGGEAN